ncbi:hypothetical protein [Novosphingobium sp. SG720]|uniref:hypothetical protein n=1 Tax=Novosphingobium sp. SG720 TaxID=2586998 RepID=UPI001447F271|nr:hypothetical protein [Novosphingobium sp. SG720]NKJ43106.1 hypothetical protein [Novosphingobium sp. SG720]
MALFKNTRFRQSLLVTAAIVAAPALATTVILTAGKAPASQSSQPVAAVTLAASTGTATTAVVAASAAATAASTGGSPLLLGAQTHFSQGWATGVGDLAAQAQAPLLRDSLPWAAGEVTKGQYALGSAAAQNLVAACQAGRRLILTEIPVNPLYDNGLWVSSEQGRTAYAAYLGALKDKFGSCLAAIELGNEINGSRAMVFASGIDSVAAYVRIAAAARARLGGNPALLGGSTNMIGTGFLRPLFAAGLLSQVDGLAVHPYRNRGEGLDVEMAQLWAAMDASGRRVPVWATEFGLATPDQGLAAGELVKQATLLAANGVGQASWYALIDQTGFPTMGLFAGTAIKDQGRAFRFLQASVLPKGRPMRLDLGDPLLFAYRFGSDTTVVWGSPRGLVLGNGTRAYGPTGAALAAPLIGDQPIVLVGKGYTIGSSAVVADTLLGWGTPAWRYFVRGKTGADTALDWLDDTWTGYFGNKFSKPLRINATSAAPAGDASAPLRAVWRYTAPAAQAVDLRGCFAKAANGDGVDLSVLRNGKVLWQGTVTTALQPGPVAVDLAAGDKLDLVAGPNQTFGGDAFFYRVVLFRRGQSTAVPCPN